MKLKRKVIWTNQLVLKGNQYWIFTGKTDAEAETPIIWPSDTKSQFLGKDPDTGKDWRPKEKGKTEAEMVGWHHQLNSHEFEQTPWDGWRTGEPSMLQFMELQRIEHNLATEQRQLSLGDETETQEKLKLTLSSLLTSDTENF